MYRPDRRNDVRIHQCSVMVSDLLRALPHFDVLAYEMQESEEDAYRYAVRYHDEGLSWVLAHSFARWRDSSMDVLSAELLVFTLYVDAGGFDPMPIC